MYQFTLILLFALAFLKNCEGSDISDKRLCYDPQCTVPISKARGYSTYNKRSDEFISFKPGDEITIYSKSAGSKQDLWGAEVNGKRGYIPKSLVKEHKILHKDSTLKYVVSTAAGATSSEKTATYDENKDEEGEIRNENSNSNIPESAVFDVFDGTTLYRDSTPIVTSTASSVQTDPEETKGVPIESPVSFTATLNNMESQSLSHSEISPISTTTMMEKPQTTDTVIETSETRETSSVVESMINLVSDLVTSENDKNKEGEPELGNDTPKSEDDMGSGEKRKEDMDLSEKVSEHAPSNGNKDTEDEKLEQGQENRSGLEHSPLDDDDDEDDDADDEDEGEEADDDEDDMGEEDEDIAEDEDIVDEHEGKGSLPNESNNVFTNETHLNEVQNDEKDSQSDEGQESATADVVVENTKPPTDGVSDRLEKSDYFVDSTLESLDATKSNEKNKDNGPTDNEMSVDDSNAINVNEEKEEESFSVEKQKEDQPMTSLNETISADEVLVTGNDSNLTEENYKKESSSNILKENEALVLQQHSEENEPTIASLNSEETGNPSFSHEGVEAVVRTADNISDTLPSSTVSEKESIMVNPDEPNDSILHANTAQVPYTTINQNEEPPQGYSSEPVNAGSNPLYTSQIDAEEKVTPVYTNKRELEHDYYSTTPSIFSEESQMEHTTTGLYTDAPFNEPLDKESYKSNVESEDKGSFQVKNQLGENYRYDAEHQEKIINNEPNQDKENLNDTPNVSDSKENSVLISEESSGFLSSLFEPISSGYGYLTGFVFGQSGDGNEYVESMATRDVSADRHDDAMTMPSENKDDQLPNREKGYFGGSVDSQCEGSSGHCEILSTVTSLDSKTSTESQEIPPEEDQEITSWMEFFSFSIGNEYSGFYDVPLASYGALIYSLISGFVVLCFFLGHYFIEGKRRDETLLAKINSLEKELTISSKECLILKEKLKISERMSSSFDDSIEAVDSMRSELEKLQNEKTQLEKELEATAEAGLEMERMMSQFLTSQQDSQILMKSIEELQSQANKQQNKITTLENSLIAKNIENDKLSTELSLTEQKVQELEEELKKITNELILKEEEHIQRYEELKRLSDSKQKDFEEDLKNKVIETEMALTRCKSLEQSLTESKDTLAIKENEISVLQECLQQLKISNGEDPDKAAIQLKDIMDFGKLKAELVAITKERDSLREELQGEEDARRLLEDHVKVIKGEVEKLRKCHETAEREKVEAQTRLEVLSSYFKEKESQLQKELGMQEALCFQKNSDATTITERMKSLGEEVEHYRSQNEMLKKELLEQERGYKSQLATFEKKANENWIAARQAERRLEESKQEAGQLRKKLTMIDKTNQNTLSQNGDDSKPSNSKTDSNGELSASPLHLGLASNSSVDMPFPEPLYLDPNASPPLVSGGRLPPPLLPPPPPFPLLPPLPRSPFHHHHPLSPPLPFMPPPPDPVLYPSSADGHRPPPLGRMSSPPPPPSPSQSPHPKGESRKGEFPSPFRDRGGGRKSSSPPLGMYHGRPDDRGMMDEWGRGRYRTPPPHSTHNPDYPVPPYLPPRPHWEDEPSHPPSTFRPPPPLVDPSRDHKAAGRGTKGSHSSESDILEKSSRHGGKL